MTERFAASSAVRRRAELSPAAAKLRAIEDWAVFEQNVLYAHPIASFIVVTCRVPYFPRRLATKTGSMDIKVYTPGATRIVGTLRLQMHDELESALGHLPG